MKIKNINIEFLGHDGFLFEQDEKRIAIDPYNISEKTPKVDIILITHSHYDHCSIKDIQKIVKKGTIVFLPADAQSKVIKINDIEMEIIEVGDKINLDWVKIESVPAYNTKKSFHPKQEGWMGFVIKFDNVIVYHAGDTDKIPEMKNLTGYGKKENEFIVLLPVSGEYTMDEDEAAEVASMLSPDLAIPMHYGAGIVGTRKNAEQFIELCKKLNINALILERKSY